MGDEVFDVVPNVSPDLQPRGAATVARSAEGGGGGGGGVRWWPAAVVAVLIILIIVVVVYVYATRRKNKNDGLDADDDARPSAEEARAIDMDEIARIRRLRTQQRLRREAENGGRPGPEGAAASGSDTPRRVTFAEPSDAPSLAQAETEAGALLPQASAGSGADGLPASSASGGGNATVYLEGRDAMPRHLPRDVDDTAQAGAYADDRYIYPTDGADGDEVDGPVDLRSVDAQPPDDSQALDDLLPIDDLDDFD